MAGWFPAEGELAKLQILVGQVPVPDLYLALFDNATHAYDRDIQYDNLGQPADADYAAVLLNPINWTCAANLADPATAAYPETFFYFDDVDTVLGWFIYCDMGAGNIILCMDLLNPPDGVVIPSGGASIGITATVDDFSEPPPP